MAIEYFERVLELKHDRTPYVLPSREHNPRLSFIIREPNPAVHQDNQWRMDNMFEPRGHEMELKNVDYLVECQQLPITPTHKERVDDAIRITIRDP